MRTRRPKRDREAAAPATPAAPRRGVVTLLCHLAAAALAMASASACRRGDRTPPAGDSAAKAHFGGKRMTGLLQKEKARMGLYKAGGLQYCEAQGSLVEYHVKELDDHSPFGAPLWGIVCIEAGAKRATLRDGQEQVLATARKQEENGKVTYEVVSPNGDLCGMAGDGNGVLARLTSYESGLWESIWDTVRLRWRFRHLLNVCSTVNGRELLPLAELQRDAVSPALFNENWKVVATDGNDNVKDVLAKIWTNPAWGSWAVEDLQEKGKHLVKPAALDLLPVIQELRRRERPPASPAPSDGG